MANQKLVVDCSNGTSELVDLTADEIAAAEATATQAASDREAAEAAATKRAEDKASGDAKLKALGLTDDEIAAR